MNHYPHHIGDFDRATRHLTRLERSVYRDLLDMYYDTETRLPLDLKFICRKIIARSDEESTAVEQVLNEFFEKTDTGYWHERCEVEIEAYRNHCGQKAMAGKASAAKKAAARERALNGGSTAVDLPLNGGATAGNGDSTNHEPEPITITSPKATPLKMVPAEKPADVPDGLWVDFLAVRKAKNVPLSATALRGIRREAVKAGLSMQAAITECCERGWAGFRADWYAREHPRPGGSQRPVKFDPVAFVNSGKNNESSNAEKVVDGERVD